MLVIAGTTVVLGDSLFITRAGGFGTVTVLGENVATVQVTLPSGPRNFTVEQGGVVSGIRGAYWHAPLALDLPKADLAKRAKVQTVVDSLMQVL